MSKTVTALVDVMYREEHTYEVADDFEGTYSSVQFLVDTEEQTNTDTLEVLGMDLVSYKMDLVSYK